MSGSSVSRRGFLGLGVGAGLAGVLTATGCSSGSSSSTQSIQSSVGNVLLPGDVPKGWQAVLEQVNAKLSADQGFTLAPQFINWSNYSQQSLLKFTAGEKFDTALQALWLNMAQLQQQGALADLTGKVAPYANLSKTLDPTLVKSNTWDGKLWGIPQVNSAGRVHHYSVRQDLAERVGQAEIASFDDLERFWYLVKEKVPGVIPYAAASNTTDLMAIPGPTAQFNAMSWSDPHYSRLAFAGKGLFFIPSRDAATTKTARLVPMWDDASVLDAFRRIRKYYQDGLINKDALNSDSATVTSQFGAGKYASTWAITDGLSSNSLATLQKAVPDGQLSNVAPFAQGRGSKPNQTFQADNLTVVNARGGNVERALKLQDWLSVQENYNLLNYGVEGTDWKQTGDDKYETLSDYSFPGYALAWRSDLALRLAAMTESEESLFDWAQSYDNFTLDPFSSFIPDTTPVKAQLAQMTSVITQFVNPLYYGVVDVDSQLDKLKKAADGAGLAKLQSEMETQANAYLGKQG